METHSENGFALWSALNCPFRIEYSPRILDDIRLAVIDAFFSLPRGGAEIGGILLGRHEKDRLVILDSLPFECEHALGPSFVLSRQDYARLANLLAVAQRNPDAKPVGWWHSHTRSEILLSESDQEIHRRFFPEPWQVALVLKPHTFEPTRAGFFFREKDGSIHGAASYREFTLDPLPMRPVPNSPSGPVSPLLGRREPAANGPVIDVAPASEPEAIPEPPVEQVPLPPPPPPAFTVPPPPPSRRWLGWTAVAVGLAVGVAGYTTRGSWIPRPQNPAVPDTLALQAIDTDGQLQIRWNSASPSVRAAASATLVIADGPKPLQVPLDPAHLQSGSYTYARRGSHVDVSLAVPRPAGQELREATTFAGAAPSGKAPPDDPGLRSERDALAAENARLKVDLARQVERNKLLDKGMAELRKAVQRDQQRKRLELQSPETAK